MTIKELSYSIVVAGKWNPAILIPPWLVANLFTDNPQMQIEFSLNFDIPSRFRVKNIIIAPSNDRVILLSIDNSDDSLRLMEEVAIKLCTILSHTPFVAVGINFSYLEKTNKDGLLPLMNFTDANGITEKGWAISNQSIKRTLTKNGYLTNLTISLDQNSDFQFDFNYHYNTINITQISECLLNKVIEYRNQSTGLLHELFNLELQTNVN